MKNTMKTTGLDNSAAHHCAPMTCMFNADLQTKFHTSSIPFFPASSISLCVSMHLLYRPPSLSPSILFLYIFLCPIIALVFLYVLLSSSNLFFRPELQVTKQSKSEI